MSPPAPFLEACLRRPTPFTPVWLMRQAGRYMPEYRALRARYGFLELCKTPAAAAEVTLQPVERLGVDAAILFADILLVLEPLGVGLEFTKGDGPRIHRPVRSAEDVRRMPPVDVADAVGYVFETVRLVQQGARRARSADRLRRRAVHARVLPDRGRAVARVPGHQALHARGADGVGRAPHAARRRHGRVPERPDRRGRPGRAALRLVGGRAVTVRLPRATCCRTRGARFEALAPGVPVIHFGTGTATLLPLMKEAGGDVIGLDWRVEIGPTWERLGHDVAVQGNLDPAILLSSTGEIRRAAAADPRRGGRAARPRLQSRPRRPQGDAGGPRHRPRRHRPRAVRRDDRRRLGAADRVRRARAIRGHPPVPRDRRRRAGASRRSASRRWRTTTS